MPITDMLAHNAYVRGSETALVEVNPAIRDTRGTSWREFELVETNPANRYRRQMSWRLFNEQANRFAHMLMDSGVGRGDKVAILLMNCLEWLPIYFGVLKAGAVAVPMNYRYDSDEIKYCLDLSDATTLIFGPEFTSRIERIADKIPAIERIYFVGEDCPDFAESYDARIGHFAAEEPDVMISDSDDAAIYFSSGTTGFPKAILHNHESLVASDRKSVV